VSSTTYTSKISQTPKGLSPRFITFTTIPTYTSPDNTLLNLPTLLSPHPHHQLISPYKPITTTPQTPDQTYIHTHHNTIQQPWKRNMHAIHPSSRKPRVNTRIFRETTITLATNRRGVKHVARARTADGWMSAFRSGLARAECRLCRTCVGGRISMAVDVRQHAWISTSSRHEHVATTAHHSRVGSKPREKIAHVSGYEFFCKWFKDIIIHKKTRLSIYQ